MIAGLSGSLFSHDAVGRLARGSAPLPLSTGGTHEALNRLRAWHDSVRHRIGPASSARAVFDLIAEPIAHLLGFRVIPASSTPDMIEALLQTDGVTVAVMIAASECSAAAVWRQGVHRGLAHGMRWCISISSRALRVFDVERAHARRYAEFDLNVTIQDEDTFGIFWGLLHAAAVRRAPEGSILDRAVMFCEQYRSEVRRSLRHGVHDALLRLVTSFRAAASNRSDAQVLDESLIVIYRMLFLLFAEARGLVPAWHPVYRDGYTIESLRHQLERNPPTGVWEALQAVARLAHRGCRAGTLRVPPFNGRLFSPVNAPLADTAPLDDRSVGQAIVALTTRRGTDGTERISYADLGVEQLGSVYEHLLDYDLSTATRGAPAVLVPTGRRKATGTFYTPRSLTEFLVRRTLAPLVHDATPAQILALRVLDPAMGSGAFLVGACRYLAAAYEQALVREGTLAPADVEDEERAAFRRTVAQRCLFGVDLNPMAVQLGRLSLWLATLAAEKPLTFLDHHLLVGNSLVGASVDDVVRQPSPGGGSRPLRDLPLFASEDLHTSIELVVGSRLSIAHTPDDTLEQVRSKERVLAQLNRPGGPLARWRMAADLWCAAWFSGARGRADRRMFRALLERAVHGEGALPGHLAEPPLREARSVADRHRFFHWTLEFPEVFFDEDGRPRGRAGFDAVIGNPPWEVLREGGATAGAGALHTFARGSGVYPLQGRGHGNLYQLFFERSLQLLKPGGRAGLILPAGFTADHGVATLRQFAFHRTSIDTFTILDNKDGIFPIHRALKFVLLTLSNSGSTPDLRLRTGVRSTHVLDGMADQGADAGATSVPRSLMQHLSGDGLAVPDVRSAVDVDILAMIAQHVPMLADSEGWGIHFGRELNASDDRPHFREDGDGLPVLEGKHIHPFVISIRSARFRIRESIARKLLDADATFRRCRLAYREVAAATNRMTLIAAVLPAGVVTTHTVFCVKEPLDDEEQHFLCGVFNSYVANYLVRMWVGTHVTAAILSRLRVPRPHRESRRFRRIARLSRRLHRSSAAPDLARLNAEVAHLYGLSRTHFSYVMNTFPLVPSGERLAALRLFESGGGRE